MNEINYPQYQNSPNDLRQGEGANLGDSFADFKYTTNKTSLSSRTINWMFNREDFFSYDENFPLSRLLPTYSDYFDFQQFIGKPYLQTLLFIEKYQLFIDWLSDLENGVFESPVYYMGLIASIEAKTSGLNAGLPAELPPIRDEKPHDFRRFTSR